MEICKACLLLEGLNKGLPKLGVGKSSKTKSNLARDIAQQKIEQKVDLSFWKNEINLPLIVKHIIEFISRMKSLFQIDSFSN